MTGTSVTAKPDSSRRCWCEWWHSEFASTFCAICLCFMAKLTIQHVKSGLYTAEHCMFLSPRATCRCDLNVVTELTNHPLRIFWYGLDDLLRKSSDQPRPYLLIHFHQQQYICVYLGWNCPVVLLDSQIELYQRAETSSIRLAALFVPPKTFSNLLFSSLL